MTTETMNAALVAQGLCWSSILTDGPRLVDVGDLASKPTAGARNGETLEHYVSLAGLKGKTEAEFAIAVRASYDGDPGPLNAIIAGPNV